jgi:CHAT domain/SIR2-like domain
MADHLPPSDLADLEVRILQRQDAGYPVEITLAGQQEFPRGYLAADVLPWASSGDLASDGQQLLDKLLADAALRSAWAQVRGQAPKYRIRLRIDATAAELHTVPWELLLAGSMAQLGAPVMLSAQTDTPFSRYLPVALPWGGAVEERPIRVLVVISNPDDLESKYQLPPADMALEKKSLEDAFAAAKDLKVDFLDAPVTLERLEETLHVGTGYHILHFLGHGSFSAARAQAAVYLQDAEGHARRVLDEELVSLLARQGVQLRLVFLSACQSATRSSADAFLGLGPKLVTVGVPAVVAMQDFVTVETARKFSSAFYRRLLEHGQVDVAANEARSALLTAGRPDAAVPVLFMRLKSGQLWSAEADARGTVLGVKNPRPVWTALMQTIKKGKCTPILGPRVHGRWLPTPQQVAQRWTAQYGYPFADHENMARVAQYMSTTLLADNYARNEWLENLKAELAARVPEELRPKKELDTLTDLVRAVGWQKLVADDPNDVHRVLASLNLPLYVTTNCDSFMVEALAACGKTPMREACPWYEELDSLPSRFESEIPYKPTPDAPLVYHLFGTDSDIASLVITEDDYLDFMVKLSEKGRVPDYIRGVLASSSLLFVGYSLQDWEFRVLMRGLVATLDRRLTVNDVAVQLEDVGEADTAAVQDFLQKYLQSAKINVFWGSTAQFIAELREHWEEAR